MENQQKPRSRFYWIFVFIVVLLIGGVLVGLFVLPTIQKASQQAGLLAGETSVPSPTANILINPPVEETASPSAESSAAPSSAVTPAPTSISPVDSMADVVGFAKQSVVVVLGQYGKSQVMHSGFVYGDGFIVTTYEGFEKASGFSILINGETAPTAANVVQYDVKSDLLVLTTARTDLIAVSILHSADAKQGDYVFAVGTPLDTRYQNLVTRGIISGVGETIAGSNDKYLITDAATNPGETGGVLFNSRGEMIGMLTDIRADAGYDGKGDPIAALGMTFVVPADAISPLLQQLVTGQSVQRATLDLMAVDLTARQKTSLKLLNGVRVTYVKTGGNAQLSGIANGDVLTAYNGVAITDTVMLDTLIAASRVGDTVTLSVFRNGVLQNISVVIKNAAE